uniref:Thiol-disulfide oxidoreductase DCC n=1 Tax=Chromera velia CCMP2878 TaxID=1169474 RepID=A0A0G4FWF6_9ALVE|eukprot:Cvel_19119.t1-p1 / transcript=Cvel_19119.t1 / gene=Cvel_19119 / organism=Chromera_velia_CCMP2878 / gene_product=Uncharacterized protein At5g50100, mitochondrial, putative / transcript_product=Uncharacterized protein At5g50100, mitochondrial, putative / location=Cvel_scaffold1624:28864-30312(-) / protein_length=310 / sequence_SO=supercontig / SO=protein_coding / is_pseudo=false
MGKHRTLPGLTRLIALCSLFNLGFRSRCLTAAFQVPSRLRGRAFGAARPFFAEEKERYNAISPRVQKVPETVVPPPQPSGRAKVPLPRQKNDPKSPPLVDSLDNTVNDHWTVNLLFDSDCPLCMREVRFLQKRDTERAIVFTDLADENYQPEKHGGVEFADGMKRIHAVLPSGDVVAGVEVFRRVYQAIGIGWVYEATKLPLVGDAADFLYDVWAANRLKLTGRPELSHILLERGRKLREEGAGGGSDDEDCDPEGECEVHYEDDLPEVVAIHAPISAHVQPSPEVASEREREGKLQREVGEAPSSPSSS